MYKLTKKALQGESARLLSISACGDWLTNGAWMIRRDKVEDGDLLKDQAAVSLKYGKLAEPADYKLHEVGRCIPRGPWVRYTRTRFVVAPLDYCMEYVVYQGEDQGIAFVQRVNADLLGPTLHASAQGGKVHVHPNDGCVTTIMAVVLDEEVAAAVMPCRGNGPQEVQALKRALFGKGEPC